LKNRRVSIPEKIAGDWMTQMGIQVEPQKRLGHWCYDFFVPYINLVIEVDGAFWHSSPKTKERDLRKERNILELGYTMFRVDAEEVRRNPTLALGVVLQNWQNFTGKEATLESDGRTFAQIKEERSNV